MQCASGVKPSSDPQIDLLGRWMHLELFYTLSQPSFVEAGLNDFIDFQVEFVEEIHKPFIALMEAA